MGQGKSVDISVGLRDALFTRDIATITKLMESPTAGWEKGVTHTHFVYALSIRADPTILRRIANVVPHDDVPHCASLAAVQGKDEALAILLPRLTPPQAAEMSGLVLLVVDGCSLEITQRVLQYISPEPNDLSVLSCATRRCVRSKDPALLQCVLPHYVVTPAIVERLLALCDPAAPDTDAVRRVINLAGSPMGQSNATLRPLLLQKNAKAFLVATSKGVLPDEATKLEVCSYAF